MFGRFPASGARSSGQAVSDGLQSGGASSGLKLSRANPQIIKKIGNKEMADRGAKGLCFNCSLPVIAARGCSFLRSMRSGKRLRQWKKRMVDYHS